jgi:ribose transport system permease protein
MTNLTVLDQTPGRDARPPMAAHQHRLVGRLLATVSTPGGAIFVLAGLLLVATIMANPNFGDPGVIIRFFGRTAPIAIAAIGQYYVIVAGEFDLSMAAVISMQVVLAGNYIGDDSGRIIPGIILMLVLGAGIGVVNGLATTVLRVPSFIVTLGMMLALAGIVDWRTGGAANQNPTDDFREIGRGYIDNVPVVEVIPYPLIILLVISVLAAWLMRRPFGRSLIAAGDNPRTWPAPR